MTRVEHHDVIIIGAGLSGINTAHTMKTDMPHRKVVILEARDVCAGTWSFFKYPGFRSDSSLTTFGFKWYPWNRDNLIAQGPDIAKYIEEASKLDGSWEKIRFNHKVVACDWTTEDAKWTLAVEHNGEVTHYTANFVLSCAGYYSYTQALDSPIEGLDKFQGKVIHPQWWDESYDYTNKRVVVIGSGATAITIVPALAEKAANVIQLQRSPSYVIPRPNRSRLLTVLRWFVPISWAHTVVWWVHTARESIQTQTFIRNPRFARWIIRFLMKLKIPKKIDADVHFNPRYNPFEQRLCISPNNEYFDALARDNCQVVTDTIKTVTEDGILLNSGEKLDADLIVTATGLHFQVFNGLYPVVDGKKIVPGENYSWRGCMLEHLPNMAFIMGYVGQSWTPGSMITGMTAVHIMKTMEKKHAKIATPTLEHFEGMPESMALDSTANYFLKAIPRIPKSLGQGVWYGRTHLIKDVWEYFLTKVDRDIVYSGISDKKTV